MSVYSREINDSDSEVAEKACRDLATLVVGSGNSDQQLLKGQCQEIVAKMSPWSSSLGLN
jgi:hypothetical protein